MSPLTNALLGSLFLVVGGAATLLMYLLRGRGGGQPAAAREAATTAQTPQPDGAPEDPAAGYLAAWKRQGDEREEYFDAIHEMAEAGESIIEPMRTRKRTTSWDDLLIKGAQLARQPLNEDEPVQTRTILGPAADRPLEIDTPIIVSHMSYGALSREIKMALAAGSASVRTAICSGEGGLLEDE